MSDDLIERLTADFAPVSRHDVARRLALGIGCGALVSGATMITVFGIRPDIAAASATAMFWMKFAYMFALAALAIWVTERLARPAGSARKRVPWLLLPLLIVFVLAAIKLTEAPAALRMPMVMGASAVLCPWRIMALGLPPLAGLIWAMRGLAPTRLRAAGAMIGLAAGGISAAVYAFHCDESTAPFLAVWYTLGVAAMAFAGWLCGPYLLRWR